mgnify:CR=1 FL=1
MIHIRHRITNEILKSLEGTDLIGADLRGADLRFAKLSGVDLRGADLRGADLSFANLKNANLRGADLRYTDLREANLRYAKLEGADLRYADLRFVIGNCKEVKSIQTYKHTVNFTATHLNIGCKSYTINQWQGFSDAQISNMDTGALKWWKDWKEIIFKMIELSEKEK